MANAVLAMMRKYRFLQLTVLLFLVLLLVPIFLKYKILGGMAEVAMLDSLVVAVGSSRTGRMLRWPLLGLWVLAIGSFTAAVWLVPAPQNHIAYMMCSLFYTIFCFGCTVGVLAYVAEARQGVTMDTLLASVVGYILLGFSFSCLFSLLTMIDPNSFNPPIVVTTERPAHVYLTMMYFSIITLTTVGYGYISPQGGFAQMFCGVEALLGQLYLAILVAYLVGSTISARMMGRKKEENKEAGP